MNKNIQKYLIVNIAIGQLYILDIGYTTSLLGRRGGFSFKHIRKH